MPTAGIGSFFPYPEHEVLDKPPGSSSPAWPPDSWVLFNSGRAALRALVEQHLLAHPRARLWVPSYYCWDVTRYVANQIAVRTYPSRPTRHKLPDALDEGDLLLVVSYFGAQPPAHLVPARQVILDSTHDPAAEWIGRYSAAWVFGSLRKTLPVPEGGYAYTHADGMAQLAEPGTTDASRIEAQRGSAAMVHKSRWIAGEDTTEKAVWYEAFQDHEAAISDLSPASMQLETVQLLRSSPVGLWRDARLRNLRRLRDALDGDLNAFALPSTFGLPMTLPSGEAADAIRREVVSQSIYPAKIWPQPEDGPVQDRDLADRMLLFHTDYRYGDAEMDALARALSDAVARWVPR